jgi:3-deoxy-D-manno-octulosonate 8-phosphate phosphatase KdsC-like HAD superfamily phosphatase
MTAHEAAAFGDDGLDWPELDQVGLAHAVN